VEKLQYRSVFISDVHLGTKACKAKRLHDFLDTFEAENLFLVGDIIDVFIISLVTMMSLFVLFFDMTSNLVGVRSWILSTTLAFPASVITLAMAITST